MFRRTIHAHRKGTIAELMLTESGGNEVLITSSYAYVVQQHRLTLDEADAFARDILARVKRMRKAQRKKP